MTKDILARLREVGLLAIVRASSPAQAVRTAGALLEGGLPAVEFTFTTPNAEQALREARQVYGDEAYLGAGTIITRAQLEAAVYAGAEYLVCPHLDVDLLQAMLETDLPCLPGIFTASEAALALKTGAHAVKLFPGCTAGPRHLKALRGPFPQLQAVVTGGIGDDDLGDWFRAGALAVGIGGELCAPELLAGGKWDEITRRARLFRERLDTARRAFVEETVPT